MNSKKTNNKKGQNKLDNFFGQKDGDGKSPSQFRRQNSLPRNIESAMTAKRFSLKETHGLRYMSGKPSEFLSVLDRRVIARKQ